MSSSRIRLWRFAECAAWAIGMACTVRWSIVYLDGAAGGRREVERFRASQAAPPSEPDLRLWSPERIAAWRSTAKDAAPVALGVLRIPRIHLEAPLLEGTDDATLNRGVGHIEGTAVPGAEGNSGLAGHRDGFFRGLKDVQAGDVIELETPGANQTYRIERTWIVDPEEVSVLDSTSTRALTVVTCYPFYFVGSAPRRFIVRAVSETSTQRR
jgi:sortase A